MQDTPTEVQCVFHLGIITLTINILSTRWRHTTSEESQRMNLDMRELNKSYVILSSFECLRFNWLLLQGIVQNVANLFLFKTIAPVTMYYQMPHFTFLVLAVHIYKLWSLAVSEHHQQKYYATWDNSCELIKSLALLLYAARVFRLKHPAAISSFCLSYEIQNAQEYKMEYHISWNFFFTESVHKINNFGRKTKINM